MAGFDYDLESDIVMKYTTLSLSNDPYYRTRFGLQGNQLFMSSGYSKRNGLRWIILTDFQGDVVLPQTFLKYKKRCELNFTSNLLDLNYYVTLKPKNGDSNYSNYDYLNWADDFDICFVGYEYSLVERMKKNKRKVLVGN